MFTGLSLDQAPPFKAPLKFFLTAPVFAMVAAVLLIDIPIHLHSSYLIAALHLFTIGFIVMVVFGALLQMLPVVAGAVIKRSLLLANITYGLMIFGMIGFALAFILNEQEYFFLAIFLLFCGLFLFAFVCLYKLLQIQNKTWIIKGMLFSLIFFILAFLIGLLMMSEHAVQDFSPFHHIFTNLHYNLIFFGFLFLLIASISFQVIPMFWVSDPYDTRVQKYIVLGVVGVLIFYTITSFLQLQLDVVYKFLMGFICVFFAMNTIQKLYNRKRKLKDISVYFYYTSMIFFVLGILYWIALEFFELSVINLGLLFGLGFVTSLMNGMLYKIVPFLTWFHLSSLGMFDIPTMREMISVQKTQLQYFFHLGAVILLLFGFALHSSYLVNYGLVLFLVSNALLCLYLLSCAKLYFIKKGKHESNASRSK